MKYSIAGFFITVFLALPLISQAQFGTECYGPNITGRVLILCRFIETVRDILFVGGLAIAVVVIIIGGIMYMTAGADESRVGKAKKTIIYGIIGFVIVSAAAFVIGLVRDVVISRLI